MSIKTGKVALENVNTPGKFSNVDAVKYAAMKKAFLEVLPNSSPSLTQSEIQEKVKKHLPEDRFPQGITSAWWAKTVQLDLESKGVVTRESCKPLRWFKS
jgi:hypothetical protein